MAVYVITIMPPGKDAKNLQGTKKLSDKSSDKQQQSPPKQLVSKGGVSEPRFSQAIDQQQSHQSNQHEAVLQHQHQTFQQPNSLQNQNFQQSAPNQQFYNVDNNMVGNCYANYPTSTDHLINMQNPTSSASMNNRMCVNPNNTPQQGNGYNGYNGQTSYGAQSGVNSHNNEISSMIMQMNNDFSKRLTMIENCLSKLGNIENEVTLVRADVSRIKTDNIDFNRRLIETEISCKTNSDFYDDMKKKTDKNSDKISKLEQDNKHLNNQLAEANSNYLTIKEDYLELQSRTMQENLLFFGIPETDTQNTTDRTQNQNQRESHNDNSEPTLNRNETKQAENTEEVLRNFIANDLPAHVSRMASDIRFDRVHRLGARKRGRTNPRPIIAKFERYSDREIVRKAGMDLNSNPYTKYKVREQFPREIEERRKLLYPVMYTLKRQNPNNRVNLVRDKLYVNGRLYVPENEPEYRLPPPSPERPRHRYQNQFGFGPRPPPPHRAPDTIRERPRYNRYENHDQGAIPKQSYRGFQSNQQTPASFNLSNRYQCLSDENERSTLDRQPGQKHKFVSPLSDQNSPKKQRDIGLYLNKADQPPLIQEIVNVENAVTSTDTDNIHTEDRDITDLNATNEVLNGQFSEPTSISETLRETRETMDTTDIQTGSSGQAEQGCA